MQIFLHKQFEKQFRKLPRRIQDQFKARVTLFLQDDTHPLLHVHQLSGKMMHYESMNINADHRALFTRSITNITFYEIGTHSELYKK